MVVLDRLHKRIALTDEVRVTTATEVLDEPKRIRPVAVGDPEDRARRARDASLRKGTVDA